MSKRSTYDELLADVEVFDREMSNPKEFYSEQYVTYYMAARRVAEQTAMNLRPPLRQKSEWDRRCRLVADRVTAQFAIPNGLIISIAANLDPLGKLEEEKEDRPSYQKMTHADVVRWIEAGQNKIPGGKRITREDEAFISKYGINAKATVVMRAYYSREPIAAYSRLRRAIQRYYHGSEGADATPILDAIAVAWKEYFSAVFPKDLSLWVASKVSAF